MSSPRGRQSERPPATSDETNGAATSDDDRIVDFSSAHIRLGEAITKLIDIADELEKTGFGRASAFKIRQAVQEVVAAQEQMVDGLGRVIALWSLSQKLHERETDS